MLQLPGTSRKNDETAETGLFYEYWRSGNCIYLFPQQEVLKKVITNPQFQKELFRPTFIRQRVHLYQGE